MSQSPTFLNMPKMGVSPNRYQQMADYERDDKPNKRDL